MPITMAATRAPISGRARMRLRSPTWTRFDASRGVSMAAAFLMSDS